MERGRKSGNFVVRLIGIIFLLIGLGLCAGGIIAGVFTAKFINNADSVIATITDIDSYRDSDGDRNHDVFVTYEVDGQTYDAELNSYSSSWHIGKEIKLYYDPENPYDVRSKSMAYLVTIILCIIGGSFTAVACGLLFYTKIQSGKAKRLKASGRKVYATVTDTVLNYRVQVNRRNPYRLDCSYQDLATGETFLYRSGNIWEDPGRYIGCQVPVYVNPTKPKEYYVAVEEIAIDNNLNHVRDYR
ncbi:DUF3592 domain-containing protein [Anaerosporobacter faecicola]|uniref:DUF3592 domain-containing protein n=1 Tax=Anaerosporobacter faecicola TaxID=2718714 RepID=UPI001438CF12|nr:DUF3592 domain-containing protein [Anaerosporobacter faecicola]